MEQTKDFSNLSAEEIHEALGGMNLSTKKGILDYIEEIRKLAKSEALDSEQLAEVYTFIDTEIEGMHGIIKVNTMVYLKNELRTKLGKYTNVKKPEDNAFLHYYKQTFENQVKTKEYTWAMIDLTRLSEQSILETLKTINTHALRAKLEQAEKADIMPMIKRIVDTQNVKLINQVRSMEGIRKAFRIRVVEENNRFQIKSI